MTEYFIIDMRTDQIVNMASTTLPIEQVEATAAKMTDGEHLFVTKRATPSQKQAYRLWAERP